MVISILSCSELDVDDRNSASSDNVYSESQSVVEELNNAIIDGLSEHVGLWDIHMDCYAGQLTSGNLYLGFWHWSDEP